MLSFRDVLGERYLSPSWTILRRKQPFNANDENETPGIRQILRERNRWDVQRYWVAISAVSSHFLFSFSESDDPFGEYEYDFVLFALHWWSPSLFYVVRVRVRVFCSFLKLISFFLFIPVIFQHRCIWSLSLEVFLSILGIDLNQLSLKIDPLHPSDFHFFFFLFSFSSICVFWFSLHFKTMCFVT